MREKKVYLRILEETDLVKTHMWINDPSIGDSIGLLPSSYKAQLEWYECLIKDKSRYVFAICLVESNEHIGNVAITHIDFINSHGMFSIYIYENKYRQLGLGTEATKLLLNFAFGKLNLNKVYLKTSEEYIAAIKMYERTGFTRDGLLIEHEYKNDRYYDKIIYSILKNNYKHFSNIK